MLFMKIQQPHIIANQFAHNRKHKVVFSFRCGSSVQLEFTIPTLHTRAKRLYFKIGIFFISRELINLFHIKWLLITLNDSACIDGFCCMLCYAKWRACEIVTALYRFQFQEIQLCGYVNCSGNKRKTRFVIIKSKSLHANHRNCRRWFLV